MILEHVACGSAGIGVGVGGVAHTVSPTTRKAFNGTDHVVSYRGNSILGYS